MPWERICLGWKKQTPHSCRVNPVQHCFGAHYPHDRWALQTNDVCSCADTSNVALQGQTCPAKKANGRAKRGRRKHPPLLHISELIISVHGLLLDFDHMEVRQLLANLSSCILGKVQSATCSSGYQAVPRTPSSCCVRREKHSPYNHSVVCC